MLHALSITAVLLLSASSGLAKPIPRAAPSVVLPISRNVNPVDPASHNAVQIDQQRARVLKQHALNSGPHDGSPQPVTNAVVIYTASVGVGNPATQYDLIVDTGSSNTWVGAQLDHPYVVTETSEPTNNAVVIVYGSGSVTGTEYNDLVTLTPDLVIEKQGVGASLAAVGFQSYDGILGVGPTDLTIGTLTPDRSTAVPTVVDNLHAQGKIDASVLGVSFNPISSDDPDGVLSFGGTDPTKFTGDITYVPITSTSPASNYWGIDVAMTYGGATIMPLTAGIVDTGTTLLLVATDTFQAYQAATGGTPDPVTGLLMITPAQYDALQPLTVTVGGTNFVLSPNAQIWPRSRNTDIGGTADAIYLVVSDMGQMSGSGLDFILGYTFLERFYSVYDTDNQRVGIATTPFTEATTN